ncbi:MAG: Mov34/MPN/PAD-1 family protein [Pirellulaceae bacterium]|nr:Mov34/MPN/PAD-1 family protein [Pirellulaceae bacterium]
MDSDIQFGEVEEAEAKRHLRPDCNKQHAVVTYGEPQPGDLPIFVDFDVMREMETHAQADTTVELGGVLLGGQFEDAEGKPFVIVTDCLRAKHYESTKGSFKFTHDTWSDISRERDALPDDLQMVGWYHTHPDWGVFLSGMDMFICDNFFNRRLDIALVIDPCRLDRGMFMWTGDSTERVRRTGGFYLIGSRFRQQELQLYAAQLEGQFDMANDPRLSGFPLQASPPPVVNISQPPLTWQSLAVVGVLLTQLLLTFFLVWDIARRSSESKPVQQSSMLANLDIEEELLRRQGEFFDQFYGTDPVSREGLVSRLRTLEATQQNDQLDKDSLRLVIRELQAESERLKDDNKQLEDDRSELLSEKNSNQQKILTLERRLTEVAAVEVADIATQEGGASQGFSEYLWPWGVLTGGVVLMILGLGVVMFMKRLGARQTQDEPVELSKPESESDLELEEK